MIVACLLLAGQPQAAIAHGGGTPRLHRRARRPLSRLRLDAARNPGVWARSTSRSASRNRSRTMRFRCAGHGATGRRCRGDGDLSLRAGRSPGGDGAWRSTRRCSTMSFLTRRLSCPLTARGRSRWMSPHRVAVGRPLFTVDVLPARSINWMLVAGGVWFWPLRWHSSVCVRAVAGGADAVRPYSAQKRQEGICMNTFAPTL